MKKIYTMLFAVGLGVAANAQLNLDFETWSGSPLTPDDWTAYSADDSISILTVLPLEGTSSMIVANTDNFDDMGGGDSLGGSYVYQIMNVVPDSIKIACAPIMMGTDTAVVSVSLYNGASYLGDVYINLHDNNSNPGDVYTLSFNLSGGSIPTFTAIAISFYSSKSPSNAGTFIVVDDVELFMPSTAGIGVNNGDAISVYPNPAVNAVNFQIGNNEVSHINIFDMSGRMINTIQVSNSLETISTDEMENGMYVYQMMNDDKLVATDKFVVSK